MEDSPNPIVVASLQAVADHFHVTLSQVIRWRDVDRCPALQTRREYYINSIDAWLRKLEEKKCDPEKAEIDRQHLALGLREKEVEITTKEVDLTTKEREQLLLGDRKFVIGVGTTLVSAVGVAVSIGKRQNGPPEPGEKVDKDEDKKDPALFRKVAPKDAAPRQDRIFGEHFAPNVPAPTAPLVPKDDLLVVPRRNPSGREEPGHRMRQPRRRLIHHIHRRTLCATADVIDAIKSDVKSSRRPFRLRDPEASWKCVDLLCRVQRTLLLMQDDSVDCAGYAQAMAELKGWTDELSVTLPMTGPGFFRRYEIEVEMGPLERLHDLVCRLCSAASASGDATSLDVLLVVSNVLCAIHRSLSLPPDAFNRLVESIPRQDGVLNQCCWKVLKRWTFAFGRPDSVSHDAVSTLKHVAAAGSKESRHAVAVLTQLRDPRVVDSLLPFLSGDDEAMVSMVAGVLGEIGAAENALAERSGIALGDNLTAGRGRNEHIRLACSYQIGKGHYRSGIPALRGALHGDASDAVKINAAVALAAFEDRTGEGLLLQIVADDGTERVTNDVLEAISRLKIRNACPHLRSRILKAASDIDRRRYLEVMQKIDPEQAYLLALELPGDLLGKVETRNFMLAPADAGVFAAVGAFFSRLMRSEMPYSRRIFMKMQWLRRT